MPWRLELGALYKVLRSSWSHDVLSPAETGKKHPITPHRNGAWKWKDFEQFCIDRRDSPQPRQPFDFALILQDICVLDVDDVARAEALERQFPELQRCPTVSTAKGRHYWFSRPEFADRWGFYDGAAQVERGVDFKSVCETGTGGIVMVPPSTGKAWLRPKLSARDLLNGSPALAAAFENLAPMSWELLNAVARPRFVPINAHLSFEDDAIVKKPPLELRGSRFLFDMAYFEPWLSEEFCGIGRGMDIDGTDDTDDSEGAQVVTVPCARSVFLALLHAMEHGQMPPNESNRLDRTPRREDVLEVLSTADKLGMQLRRLRMLRRDLLFGPSAILIDLVEIFGHTRRRSERHEPLVPVTASLARSVTYRPLKPADPETFLFSGVARRTMTAHRLRPSCEGDPVLDPSPAWAIAKYVDPRVAALLRRFEGSLALAGGSVLGIVAPCVAPGSDYDLFVLGDEVTGREVLTWMRDVLLPPLGACPTVVTGAAITVVMPPAHERYYRDGDPRIATGVSRAANHAVVMQVILRTFPALPDVLHSFDIAPSRVAAVWRDGGLQVLAAGDWTEALATLAFPMELDRWTTSSVARALKYVARGFDVAVPGARRTAFRDLSPVCSSDVLRDIFAGIAQNVGSSHLFSWGRMVIGGGGGGRSTKQKQKDRERPGVRALFVAERRLLDEMAASQEDRPEMPDARQMMRVMREVCAMKSDYDEETLGVTDALVFALRQTVGRCVNWVTNLLSIGGGAERSGAARRGIAVEEVVWQAYDPERPMLRPCDPCWYAGFDHLRWRRALWPELE